MIFSKMIKIRIPKEDYIQLKLEAQRKGKTFSFVFREKLGAKNPSPK